MGDNYSRRRPKSKGPIAVPTHRTHQDAVTGETVTVELDGVQKCFESVRRAYDAAVKFHNLNARDLERLADMLAVLALRSRRHRERDIERLRALLDEAG